MLTNTNTNNSLNIKTRKKNDFVQLEEGAYPRMFIEQIEAALAALATGKLRGVRMVKRHKRTNRYIITMGFGKRHTWFPNVYIPQGEFAECDNVNDAMSALRTILKAARAGEFDDELEDLRERRQHHAKKMILARNKCGFHSRKKEQPLALPAPSEMPMAHITHSNNVVADAR
jgi:hypothetical protein